jgi:hypothetical protein
MQENFLEKDLTYIDEINSFFATDGMTKMFLLNKPTQSIFVEFDTQLFPSKKVAIIKLSILEIFRKMPNVCMYACMYVSNRPIGENWPNLVTLLVL